MKRHEHLEEAMCRELEKLDKKYGSGTGDMEQKDLETADLIYHALKSAETYHAMKEAGEESAYSGARGRYPMRDVMGRFVSRDMDPEYSGYRGVGSMYGYPARHEPDGWRY